MFELAFSKTLRIGLKPRIKFAIYALPVIFVFASFICTYFLSVHLASELGIADGVPVKDQENGDLWMLSVSGAFFGLVVFGYVAGWVMNIPGSILLLGWPYSKAIAVFVRSEVPQGWYRAPKKY